MTKFLTSRAQLVLTILLTFLLTVHCNKNQTDSDKAAASYKAFNPGKLNPDAPPETEQFGQLVGVWDATLTVRNRDGTWSENKIKAEWRWYYILDGHAIQDDWIVSPSNDQPTNSPPSLGTNIRIYNSKEKAWEMAWIDNRVRKLTTFKAVYEDGKIIINSNNARGQQIRNTFHNITKDSFDWQQEWTLDEGKNLVCCSPNRLQNNQKN